jgi:hypothetical protein
MEAVLAAGRVVSELEARVDDVRYYTDSKLVLAFIKNSESRFQGYVTRRIEIILDGSRPHQWRYVSTDQNQADFASRPTDPTSLMKSCWLSGPRFLWNPGRDEDKIRWLADNERVVLPEELPNITTLKSCLDTQPIFQSLFARLSSWDRVVAVVEMIMRFTGKWCDKVRQAHGIHLACVVLAWI